MASQDSASDTAVLETAETVGSGETATSVSQAVMPAFGLVRVEPDGSAVIAGSATPSGQVHIFANDDQIGTETAQGSGDFAFVTDAPLPTGGVELRILDVETDQFAGTSVIVVVQDDRTSEPLVIASAPGEASEFLQGLDSPIAMLPTDQPPSEQAAIELDQGAISVAEAETAEPETDQPVQTLQDDAGGQDDITENDQEGAQEVEPEPASVDGSEEPAAVASLEEATPAPTASQPEVAPSDAPVSAPAVSPEPVTSNSDAPEPADGADDSDAAEEEAPAIAESAEPFSADAFDVAAATELEAEEDLSRPQAEQPAVPAADVELDASADEANWADVPVAAPADDASLSGESESAETAAVSEEEIMSSSPDGSTAAPEQSGSESQPVFEEAAVPTRPATSVATQEPIVAPTIDAIEIDGDLNFFAGAGEDGLMVRLYVDNQLVGSTQVGDGRWLVESNDTLDQESQRIRIDMLAADGSVVGRAEVDFILDLPDDIVVAEQSQLDEESTSSTVDLAGVEDEATVAVPEPAMPEAVAPSTPDQPAAPSVSESPVAQTQPADVPEPTEMAEAAGPQQSPQTAATPDATEESVVPTLVGVSDGNRTAAGMAIIRQGDNLWTIARRVYGEGIRYTQIFEANTDQIRNPDLIYPGQVFDLPGTDEVIGESDSGDIARQ